MMNGSTFWNINDGKRDHFDVFGEWEARWSEQWLSQLGVRSSTVWMDTGDVQGYNVMDYGNPAESELDSGRLQCRRSQPDRSQPRSDGACCASPRTPSRPIEAGFARKTRSPNLYERYAWSTNNAMTMTMINWFGDGNGYVGNLNLKPEVANTISATASWHDAARQQWGFSTPYYTYVQDYIDARRCFGGTGMSPCQGSNLTRTTGFVYLQFVNQSARLYGADVSGYFPLLSDSAIGDVKMTGVLSYVRGENLDTDDNLYHIMPLNAKLALVQKSGAWTNTLEGVFVDAKTKVSQVRNELKPAATAC
jgi:iron complex outermembrane receptor protein